MKAEYRPPCSKERKPLQDLLPLDTPLTIYIDPSNICNFSCKFCFHGNKDKLEEMPAKKMMRIELFKKIVNDLKEFPSTVKMIHLHGFGEPLLNKNLAEMIKLLKNSNVVERVAITTNASTFTDENMKAIIEAGLDQIHISIYGLSQEQYMEFSHNKCNYLKLIENIKKLYDIKGSCHIHIKITGDYFSDEKKNLFLNTFGDYSDTIFVDNAANIWPGLDITDTLGDGQKLKHQYGQNIVEDKVCPNLFYQLLIHSDGFVSPCCADYRKKIKIGDVNKESLMIIWNNSLLNTMRINHLKRNVKNYAACTDCEYPFVASTVNINPYINSLLEKYEQ